MNKFNPMCINYNSYKVEFAMRDTAHIHGVLWMELVREMSLFAVATQTIILDNVEIRTTNNLFPFYLKKTQNATQLWIFPHFLFLFSSMAPIF